MAHSSNVSSVVLGKGSGRMLATGGDDCRVNIWSVSKPNCIMSLTGHTTPIESLQVNPNEKLIVAGSRSGSIRVWDLEAAKVLRTLPGHKANICSLHFHPFGSFVASGSLDTNIKLWDVRRKGCIFTFKGHTEAVRCLRFSPDGKWVASAADDHTVKLWDLTAGKLMFEFTGHTGPVNVVEFHPNEYLLASGSSDRTVRFWDLEKFQVVSCIEEEATPVRCVLFNPDGCCLYSGFQDSLRVYGWEPERCFDVVLVNWGKVADLSISNNQLIGVSFAQSTVSSFVVDLSRVPKSDSVPQGLIRDDQPLVPPTPTGSSLRRIYDRPSTSCSKPQSRVKHNSESERHSPSSEDDRDEKESKAEIQNQEDYKEIFQPKNAICRTPPRNEPFPAPPEDEPGTAKEAVKPSQAVDVQTMCVVLTSRHKNLDAVRAVWSTSDIKNSLDSAVAINDLSVVVDLLNIVNQKASLWKLDLCTIVLPQIEKLLQSKYESYVQTGCTSLKLILQRFLPLITDILAAPPSVGVDISREERLHKCKLCYKQLKNISNVVKNKSGLSGRHGSAFRELLLLMAVLD
ncbi:katanin p80 WD40 repeat-containing subunit B1 isoform X2 [Geospiza fortis]|uniref:Katanin p80 WD40 repeat-containing subunit B1 n=1 Tax=Geospiza fortis TaxID=48883 RepID=A0A8N5ENN6_GEOFO|nr:katanin p80 WD40 repeat-containing subunit B1 isoform X2 [Geospiza fortis]